MNVNCFQDSNRRNSKGGGRRVTKKGSSDGRGKRFKTPESEAKHRRKVKRDQKRRDNRRLKEFILKLLYLSNLYGPYINYHNIGDNLRTFLKSLENSPTFLRTTIIYRL